MKFSEYKKFYQSIGAVRCIYFGGDEIVFNKKGWNHLLFSKGIPRSFNDRKRRLRLLIYCKRILEAEHIHVEYRVKHDEKGPAQFWAFEVNIDGMGMRLLVRKVGEGTKHFFDIFPL